MSADLVVEGSKKKVQVYLMGDLHVLYMYGWWKKELVWKRHPFVPSVSMNFLIFHSAS